MCVAEYGSNRTLGRTWVLANSDQDRDGHEKALQASGLGGRKMWMSKSFSLLVVFGSLCATGGTMAFGQAVTASSSLAGTVSDKSGAVVVGASVMAVDTATGSSRSATTNSLGFYRFDVLPPGIYSVRAAITGFSTSTANRVELLVGRTTTRDFSLTPG